MKTRLIRIGNSRGVRLPKPLIEQADLSDEVDLQIREGAVVISRIAAPRAGWGDAAATLGRNDEEELLIEHRPTEFEETEWSW